MLINALVLQDLRTGKRPSSRWAQHPPHNARRGALINVLVLQDLHTGKEAVVEVGRNSRLTTPAGVPHLFEFIEDNALLEWWDCPYQAWFYEPYRSRIRSSLEPRNL